MKLYKFAFRIISFFSNLNGTIYTQCLAGIKCDEVRITNEISTSQKKILMQFL